MVVPEFQAFMLPTLQSLNNQKDQSTHEITQKLKDFFKMSDEDLREKLPSGGQTVFNNRASWARTYLKKAGLIESPARAKFRITELGIAVLLKNPQRIDNRFLSRFPEFNKFHYTLVRGKEQTKEQEVNEKKTPEEVMADAYDVIKASLAQDLITKILEQPPDFFERLVVDLLVRMGYGGSVADAGKAIGRVGDEGIDGIIKEDPLGLGAIYIQAKRWIPNHNVGPETVQQFGGALIGQKATKGIFITTSSFTKAALNYNPGNNVKLVLIDGVQLAELMIDNNVGVHTIDQYEVKKIDDDYFTE